MKLTVLARRRPKSYIIGVPLLASVVGGGVLWITLRTRADTHNHSDPVTPPTAAVVKVVREDVFKEVAIPAEFRPYEEVELHAKVSGYVKAINVDIGDRVKAGQLLATLEVPELQDELRNAIAARQKADVNYTNTHLVYTRLLAVNEKHANLVAQQDLDNATAADLASSAAVAAADAELEKYRTLIGYTQIVAPFDGVVTRRSADPGTLIQAGTSSDTQSRPLVRISNNYRLRLDFPVTVDYVKDVHVGDAVRVCVDSLNGKTFAGTITRSSGHVEENTRTMLVEIETPNPDLKLIPGMYAAITLRVQCSPQALVIPIEALAEKSSTVLVVNRNHQIEERRITLGLETADRYEVLSGLSDGELVLIGNQSGIRAGEKVEPKLLQMSLQGGP